MYVRFKLVELVSIEWVTWILMYVRFKLVEHILPEEWKPASSVLTSMSELVLSPVTKDKIQLPQTYTPLTYQKF